jgi:hypothetical protein
MRPQREIDRDAAVAILERDDDVTPQIAIRERACEEDERRASTRRSPGQGPKPSFQPFRFHAMFDHGAIVRPANERAMRAQRPGRLAHRAPACAWPAVRIPR